MYANFLEIVSLQIQVSTFEKKKRMKKELHRIFFSSCFQMFWLLLLILEENLEKKKFLFHEPFRFISHYAMFLSLFTPLQVFIVWQQNSILFLCFSNQLNVLT